MRRAPALVLAIGGAAALIVFYLDFITGWELAFALFYLAPIAFVVWFGRRGSGLGVAVFSTFLWWYAEFLSERVYSHEIIGVWNALIRFGVFGVVALLLESLRRQLDLVTTLAHTDSLTGLLSRGRFYELLEQEVARSRRYQHPLSVAYLDVDDFKAINDRYGHAAGDRLLTVIADTLGGRTRGVDLAARLGGDEFILLMPESAPEAAYQLVVRLQSELKGATRAAGLPVTFSTGVMSFMTVPEDGDAVTREVDRLMYEVKREGKDGLKQRIID